MEIDSRSDGMARGQGEMMEPPRRARFLRPARVTVGRGSAERLGDEGWAGTLTESTGIVSLRV